ncbi:uncharacterized protein LOC135133938 [Zophobas morio]|uniref:uncharacterized protein LOC135133938 n=1 Tax=Zophobas morio TaxID=2755281 RepID=UPI003082AB3D
MSHNAFDYYWREYKGAIPQDAVVAGQDGRSQKAYIGQAYVKGFGLMVIHIRPNAKELYAPICGVKNVNEHIKILCGHQPDFKWIHATAKDLHVRLSGRHGVIGGHEDGLGSINIGRISYEGGTQIGKINSFGIGNAYFKYVENPWKESGEVQSYEVLVYEKCK